MWRLVGKVLQVTLFAATAAALFVVGAVVVSTLRPGPPPESRVDPADAILEIKLSTSADTRALFAGQPLVVDLVLLNLSARRARNQVRVDPEGAAAEAAIPLDDVSANLAWEHRLQLRVSTPGGGIVLNDLDLSARLLDPDIEPSDRRLELAPARTTFVLEGDELADLLPGPYIISAVLPSDIVPPERVAVTPLEIEMLPEPSRDADRAVVSLGIARVAAMRGHSAEAVEAGLTALALDPLQDEALMVVAEGWEQQGDIERAVEWYERHYQTPPASRDGPSRSISRPSACNGRIVVAGEFPRELASHHNPEVILANRGRPTQTKRQRERARMERQKMKEVRRSEVRARKSDEPARPSDHDPDIAGMVAGPQEMPDWQREFFEEEQKAKEAAELSETAAQKE